MNVMVTMEWIVGETTKSRNIFVNLEQDEIFEFTSGHKGWEKEGDTVWYSIEQHNPASDLPVLEGLTTLLSEIDQIKNEWY